MKYNPDIHHRRSLRLKEYDYSREGAYFVTICCQNKECLFGGILNRVTRLNQYGKIVGDEWLKSTDIRSEIELDEFIIMPNHFHGIVVINRRGDRLVARMEPTTETGGGRISARGRPPVAPTGPKSKSVGALIDGFKSSVTKQINGIRDIFGISVWQRNCYEHVIRNETELNKIREYIINNPLNWQDGENYKNSQNLLERLV